MLFGAAVGRGKEPFARQRSGCSPCGPYGEEVMTLPTSRAQSHLQISSLGFNIFGLCEDNDKENGNYYSMMG